MPIAQNGRLCYVECWNGLGRCSATQTLQAVYLIVGSGGYQVAIQQIILRITKAYGVTDGGFQPSVQGGLHCTMPYRLQFRLGCMWTADLAFKWTAGEPTRWLGR